MSQENSIAYMTLAALLMLAELYYFDVADRFKILDRPNERSSHRKPVVRGGGIVFLVALIFWFFWRDMPWPLFMIGISAASIISFLDDIKSQPPALRFFIHLFAVLAVFFSIGLFSWPVWLWFAALVVSIGALNAFNFMDGINGITGIYALVMLCTFLYINEVVVPFTDTTFVVVNIISVMVFLFFNFRKRARCFAGDVGSVTIAFILIFLLLQLIYETQNLLWVILFLIYGIDSVVTIVYRLRRKENIFQPHRTHLYQYLCNELKWQHRTVSALYGAAQLFINVVLVYAILHQAIFLAIGIGFVALLFYLFVRGTVLKQVKA